MQKLNIAKILAGNGWKKRADGRYQNPETNRPYTRDKALDRIAKDSGYKSYNDYKKARIEKTSKVSRKGSAKNTYQYFEEWAKSKGLDTTLGKQFSKDFAKWRKKKFERRSPEMRKLLKLFGWLNRENYERYA